MEFPFNNDWILSQLTDHCKDFVIEKGSDTINNIAIKNVGKNGFLASVFLVIVEFSAGSNFEVIVKLCGRVLGDSDEPSFNDFFLNGLHNRECLFYEILAPFLPIPIPKTYSFGTSISAKVCGFILMESLIGRGESFHFSQSLTLGQMLELAGFVAQLQSHAMLLKDQSWIEEFGQATFDMKAQIEVILSAFKRLKKIRNGELKTEAEILASLVNKNFTEFSQYKLHQKLQIPPVLAHGTC
ncbi:hypothetical protein L596_023139 [Steinernema carpocapsae]|uniref:CHK kinase-like domain-containing protein n=1 Tax=Steinernema carpocapsae TaxID=34508 RepID=A0A4U5MCZ4_STECR|nr:hypothetical protein L596_023139 [Steinernema carpocapsae]